MTELLSCPFCGGKAVLMCLTDPQDDCYIQCTNKTCGVQQIARYDRLGATRAWNTRSVPARQEPVAWRWRSNEENRKWRAGPNKLSAEDLVRTEDGFEEQPLYAAPVPQPEGPQARGVLLRASFILKSAAEGGSVQIAAGQLLPDVRAALAAPPPQPSGPQAREAELRSELRKLAIKQHVRPAYGGGEIKNGKSCAVCKGEWADTAPEFHATTCPLAALPIARATSADQIEMHKRIVTAVLELQSCNFSDEAVSNAIWNAMTSTQKD